MPARDKRKIEKALKKKGFKLENGDHRYFIYYSLKGERMSFFTKTSHGPDEPIGDDLLSEMAAQCKLSNPDFLELIDCTLKRKGYEKILLEKGIAIK